MALNIFEHLNFDLQVEELLTGFLRALDVAKQYPSLAMEAFLVVEVGLCPSVVTG